MQESRQTWSNQSVVVEEDSLRLTHGGAVDFNQLSAAFKTNAIKVVLAAAALANATTLNVAPLSQSIGKGEILAFPGNRVAIVSAAAPAGAVLLPVASLKDALENNLTGKYGGKDKEIPAFTAMVRLASRYIVPYSERPGNETIIGLIGTNANEHSSTDSLSGYRIIVGGVLNENLLPDAVNGVLPADIKAGLAACGTGFSWQIYEDSRAL